MLVQLPQQPQEERRFERKGERPSFEAALSRDLASVRVIAYGPIVGGVGKRVGDLAFAVVTAPAWGPLLLGSLLVAQVRHAGTIHSALKADACVGYGGARFKRCRLHLSPPSAEIVPLNPQAQEAVAQPPEPIAGGRITWRDVIQRLPEMINILKGEMSLVGPRPVSHEDFEALRGGGKYYACARPGFVSASDCGPSDDPEALLCKYYAMRWNAALDVRIIWLALKRFRLSARVAEQRLPPEPE